MDFMSEILFSDRSFLSESPGQNLFLFCTRQGSFLPPWLSPNQTRESDRPFTPSPLRHGKNVFVPQVVPLQFH